MIGNVRADFSEQFDRTHVLLSLTVRVGQASDDDEFVASTVLCLLSF